MKTSGFNQFYKYHGAGNDFILVEDLREKLLPSLTPSFIRQICNRSTGIGADGLLVIQPSILADVTMRIFNCDGEEVSCCGNGLRSVVRHFNKPLLIETKAGISQGELAGDLIRVSLPKSEIIQLSIPFVTDILKPFKAHFVNTGVPHLVVFVEDLDFSEFQEIGPYLRHHKQFGPEGTNVTFAKKAEDQIFIRTYERGVEGETNACGTGGAAALLVHNQIFKPLTSATIIFPSKETTTYFNLNHSIWMEGPAEAVFTGFYTIKISSEL